MANYSKQFLWRQSEWSLPTCIILLDAYRLEWVISVSSYPMTWECHAIYLHSMEDKYISIIKTYLTYVTVCRLIISKNKMVELLLSMNAYWIELTKIKASSYNFTSHPKQGIKILQCILWCITEFHYVSLYFMMQKSWFGNWFYLFCLLLYLFYTKRHQKLDYQSVVDPYTETMY